MKFMMEMLCKTVKTIKTVKINQINQNNFVMHQNTCYKYLLRVFIIVLSVL